MEDGKRLLERVRIGDLELKNRFIMAPLTRCRASEGRIPNALMAEYYRQRAGAGLILSEATAIDPMGVGYPRTPGIWTQAQVEGWKGVTRAVHEAGGRIFLQLWHVGRISDPYYLGGALPVAPSAIAPKGHVSHLRPKKPFVTPRALETEEIPEIVEAYHRGADLAKRAGFDGVEVHGANGYLPDQFLQDHTNKRTDAYGGSIENRARLILEAVDAAIDVWGPERVGLHIAPPSPDDEQGDSTPAETFTHVAREVGKRGIAFLFVREPVREGWLGPQLKAAFNGPYIINQGLEFRTAEIQICAGVADAASWGRRYIANPDLPRRYALETSLNPERPELFYGEGSEGYTDYPFLEES